LVVICTCSLADGAVEARIGSCEPDFVAEPMTGLGIAMSVKVRVTVAELSSVTRTMKLFGPATPGTPEMRPLVEKGQGGRQRLRSRGRLAPGVGRGPAGSLPVDRCIDSNWHWAREAVVICNVELVMVIEKVALDSGEDSGHLRLKCEREGAAVGRCAGNKKQFVGRRNCGPKIHSIPAEARRQTL